MKKYMKEIIILLLQGCVFYILPLTAGPTDMMGLILVIILATLVLSILMGVISEKKIKYSYPVLTAILFAPTVMIYYNESAYIHVLWYFIVSIVGMVIGIVLRKF